MSYQSNLKINRNLKDKGANLIDHALGRPVDPLRASFRNYFVTTVGAPEAVHMAASPHWNIGKFGGTDSVSFTVNDVGRKYLSATLKAEGFCHRLYDIEYWDGMGTDNIAAETASKARYSAFLNITDIYEDLSFFDFCKLIKVRLNPEFKAA